MEGAKYRILTGNAEAATLVPQLTYAQEFNSK